MSEGPPERSTPVVRTLLATQFAFNVGFYAVVPFIAVRLYEDLAATGTAIAATLAVRTFSQQGMFVFGGALADRYGARRLMVAGTAVRALGYLALALAGSVPWMVVAAALTGIGGALFSPALESLLASTGSDGDVPTARAEPDDASNPARRAAGSGRRSGPSRERLFALLAVCGEVGAVLGPVLGAVLLVHGFTVVALAGAALFAVVGLVLHLVLPAGPPRRAPDRRPADPPDRPRPASWRVAARDKRFVIFCLAYSSYLLSYNQLYVVLPVELDRTGIGTGIGAGDGALAGLFLLTAVLIVVGQLPVAALTRRVPVRVSLPIGFVLMATGFAVVALAAPQPPVEAPLLPAIIWVVLLTVGQMTVVPVAMDQVGRFAGPRPAGAYYGWLATAGGVAVLLGSLLTGPFLDAARVAAPGAGTVWWLMAVFPAISAVVLAVLFRPERRRASAPVSENASSKPIPIRRRNGPT